MICHPCVRYGPCLIGGPGGTIPEHLYLADSVKYYHSPRRIASSVFADFARNGLTATQISEHTGLSKQAVLSRLRKEGVRPAAGHGRSKDNYRYPNSPFGLRVVSGRLVISRSEMKIVRLIVKLRTRSSLGWEAIVDHLNNREILTRTGRKWDRARIRRIYKRWANKL